MTFGDLLKKIGLVAEAVAVSTVPGAQTIDAGVHAIVNAKTTSDREQAIFTTALAGVDELSNFDISLFSDQDAAKKLIVQIHDDAIQLKGLIK